MRTMDYEWHLQEAMIVLMGLERIEEKGGKTPPKINRTTTQRVEKRRTHAKVHTHKQKMI